MTQLPGFEPPQPLRKRLILSVDGMEKQGKTHFSLTAPGPVAILNVDVGLEGVVNKFLTDGKEILVCNIEVPDQLGKREQVKIEATEAINKFDKNYTAALESPDIRTIIVDTGTELWELYQLAEFGKISQNNKYAYGPVNVGFTEILRRGFAYDKNVIFTHKMKKEYQGENWNGSYERAGFKNVGFIVQATIQAYRDKDNVFHVRVVESRHNPDLNGQDFEQGNIGSDFPSLAMLMVDGTELEDWS